MVRDGSSKKHQVLIILLLFLFALSFFIPGILYYRKAFPEASIDFKISRIEASTRAKAFLEKRGINLTDYFETIRFDYDGVSKTYLDREVGVEKMDSLIADEVHLWRWKIRWFKPLEQEEYEISLSPEGRIVGYRRIVPEEEERESLAQEEAFLLAEDFLRQDVAVPLDRYDFIEQDFEILRNRTDFKYTWQRKNFDVPDGEYRISVTVQGNEIGSYQGFIKIPEEWRRNYSGMRSQNQLLQKVTFSLTLPLLVLVPITILIRMRRRDVCWTVVLALSLCIFVSHVLLGVNSIPLMLSQFDTTQSMGSFAGTLSLSILVEALLNAVTIFLIVGASEPLYREQNPMRLSLSKFMNLRFFKTKEFFSSTLVGYSMALFHIGYVVLFYYFGRGIGIWSPAEVGYTDALSTYLPWIYPLTVSLTASLTEELLFRVFAISILRRFFPTWIAVLIPAFLWGFLHSNYPQQPFFIRGIEVGILGIIAGYIFLRWGIFATLIWHYTIDAVFIGLFLFSSTNFYFILSGAIIIGLLLLPMVLVLFGLIKERQFATSSGLLNRDASEAMHRKREETGPYEPQIRRKPLVPSVPTFSKRNIGILLILFLISMLFLILIKPLKVWPSIQLLVSRTHAKSIAMNHLHEKGIEVDPYYHVTSFANQTGSYEDRYIQNVSGWDGLREAYILFKETGRWKTRFFIPMSEEEYIVSMNEDGQDLLISHLLPEKRKGPSTTKEIAEGKAIRYLIEERKIPMDEYALVDSYEDQKPARRDYYFVWRWEKAKAGEGEYRISVSLAGDEISQYSKFIKVPEKWIRKDREEGILQVLFSFLKVLLFSLGGGLAIVLFARDFMHRKIEWKRVLIVPSLAVLCYALLEVNRLPAFLSDYRTSLSLSNYFLSEILTRLFYTAGLFLFLLILTTAVLSLFRETYGSTALWLKRIWARKELFASSLVSALSAFFIIVAFSRVFAWVNGAFDFPRTKIAQEALIGVDAFLPFLEISIGSLIYALIATLFIFFGFFLYQRYIRSVPYLIMVALPAIAIYFLSEVKNISEFIFLFMASVTAFAITYFILNRLIQVNVFSCILALLWWKAIPHSLLLVSQPIWFYRIHGFLSLLLVLLPLLWVPISLCRRNERNHH